jgi:hypothetical protein
VNVGVRGCVYMCVGVREREIDEDCAVVCVCAGEECD